MCSREFGNEIRVIAYYVLTSVWTSAIMGIGRKRRTRQRKANMNVMKTTKAKRLEDQIRKGHINLGCPIVNRDGEEAEVAGISGNRVTIRWANATYSFGVIGQWSWEEEGWEIGPAITRPNGME